MFIGCPNRARGHLRSLPACLELSVARMHDFLLDPIVTHGEQNRVELTVEMLLFLLCTLLVIYIPDATRKHRNFGCLWRWMELNRNTFITLETSFQPNMELCHGGRIHNHLFVIFFLSMSVCVCVCDPLVLFHCLFFSFLFFLVQKHSHHYTVVYGLHIYC